MNRRTLLRPLLPVTPPTGGEKDPVEATEINPFVNKELPGTIRSRAGLKPYSGPWGFEQAAHLLRRTTFGPKLSELQRVADMGLSATIDVLFATNPMPSPPVNFANENDPTPIGETWIEAPVRQGVNGARRASLLAWSIGQILNDGISIREKMTLFWHNHFVIELPVANEPRAAYQYVNLLRTHALGNFRTLTEEMTIQPSMLFYLNGNQNIVGAPNENFARELFELFTIGKGPIVGEGDYTHYTEEDVRAAAKVLTGWNISNNRNGGIPESRFQMERHDTSEKSFSHAFDHQLISNNGENEFKDLIAMIFSQKETARFICRKLYRWFVYYVIDEAAEKNVIEPMVQILIDSQFEIAPALKALLSSEHFFDPINQGCMIKNPIDFVCSIFRQFEIEFPESSNITANYTVWRVLANVMEQQQMLYLTPPNVAGWAAYHQEPQYYETWITSATLPARARTVNSIIDPAIGIRIRRLDVRMILDPFIVLSQISDPLDPNILISEFVGLLFPQAITEKQHAFLKDILLPGLPDEEWTNELSDYLAQPNNLKKRAIDTKLRALLKTMMNMAEYQLS